MKNLKYLLCFVVIFIVSFCMLSPFSATNGAIATFATRKAKLIRMQNELNLLINKNKFNKYALIVAVSDYDNISKLNNTLNDARDVEAALGSIGFLVRTVLDKDKNVIDKEIIEYLEELKRNKASEGIIYIAGHGGQVYGRNYLFCKNALSEDSDVGDNMVDINKVWKKMQNTGGLFRMMVLDICRTNPFSSQDSDEIEVGKMKKMSIGKNSRGVWPMKIDSDLTSNAIMLYSTDEDGDAVDGSGRNSPFAESFIDWIIKPIDIYLVVNSITREVREKTHGRQVPYMNSSLTEGYILNRSDPALVKKRQIDIEKMIEIHKKIESELKMIENGESQAAKKAPPTFGIN